MVVLAAWDILPSQSPSLEIRIAVPLHSHFNAVLTATLPIVVLRRLCVGPVAVVSNFPGLRHQVPRKTR